jgi:hypothetical protein
LDADSTAIVGFGSVALQIVGFENVSPRFDEDFEQLRRDRRFGWLGRIWRGHVVAP